MKAGQGPAGALINIDGKNYSEEELIGDDKMEFAEAYGKIHDLRMDRISGLLLQKTYEEAAKKANVSVEEYVENTVLNF